MFFWLLFFFFAFYSLNIPLSAVPGFVVMFYRYYNLSLSLLSGSGQTILHV